MHKIENRPISDVLEGLDEFLAKVPEDRRLVAESLRQKILFLERTLERLREKIDNGDVVEEFKQGKQSFMREHPALKSYNTTFQRYSAAYKQLCDLLPTTPDEEAEEDELKAFIESGKRGGANKLDS